MATKPSSTLFYADDWNEGLRTDVSAVKAPEGSLVVAENVRYVPEGGFYMRRGGKKMSWNPGTALAIEQFGKSLEHDVLFVKSGTKIFQTSDETTLYDIGVARTTGYAGQFVEYNSELKYTNGKDIYLSITVGKVKTQFTAASTAIVTESGHTDLFRVPKTGAFTTTHATETINATAHGLSNGDRVAFTNSGGALPTGFSTVTEYFVRNVSANAFQVSLTPLGAIVTISDDGTGTHTFTDGILYCMGNLITYTKKKSQAFTADATSDVITSAGHALESGSIIQVSSATTLPAGLSASTDYYVIEATTDTFKVSATLNGSAVNITDAGTGVHTLSAMWGGDTFTGVTIPTGTYVAGSILTQTKDCPYAPKGTVLDSFFEKMVVGGVPHAGHVEYYTVTASPETPHDIDDFVSDGADTELFGKFGSITGMKALLTKGYVAKQRGLEAWTGIDDTGIPIRTLFTDSVGAVNPDCFILMGDKLVMLTSNKGIKTIEPDTTGVDPEPVLKPYFDAKIKGTLKEIDTSQTRACMGYSEVDELLRVTTEKSDVLQTIILDTGTNGFSVDTGYAPACWIEWRGNMYFGDANDDDIWKAETDYTDGSSSPSLLAVTPIHYVGDRRRKSHVGHIFLTGLIKTRTTMVVEIWCDGVLHRTVNILGTGSYVSKTTYRPLGRDALGRSPVGRSGGEATEDDGFEFSVGIDVNFECRYVQLKFKCQGTGYGVQVDSYEGVRGDAVTSGETQIDLI